MNPIDMASEARRVNQLVSLNAIECKDYLYLEDKLYLGEFRLINKPDILQNTYYVNYNGLVYSKKTNKILHNMISKYGYNSVILSRNTPDFTKKQSGKYSKHFYIHTLVAEAFLGKCPKNIIDKTINHKDGNPTNNIFTNLEWMERSKNTSLQINRKGISKTISELIGCEINKNDGRSLHEISNDLNVNYTSVLGVKLGKINPEVSKKYNLDRLVHHKISNEIADKIGKDISLRKLSYTNIAEKYNVDISVVRSILRGANHKEVSKKYNLDRFIERDYVGYDKALAIGLEIKNANKSNVEIATEFNTSISTISKIKNGSIYPEVSKKYNLKPKNKLKKNVSDEIYVLSKIHNFNNFEVCKLYNISISQLYNIRNRNVVRSLKDIETAEESLKHKNYIE